MATSAKLKSMRPGCRREDLEPRMHITEDRSSAKFRRHRRSAVALEVAPIAVLRVHLQSYGNIVLLLPVLLLDWSIVPSPIARQT